MSTTNSRAATLAQRLRGWLALTGDLLIPQTCASCGEWIACASGGLCENCRVEIERAMSLPYCPRCARSVPTIAIHASGCAFCKTEHHWNLRRIVRVGDYRPALRRMVLGLKYIGQYRQARFLSERLGPRLRAEGWFRDIDALISVPMHSLRRVQRPCPHAAVLTQALSQAVGVRVSTAIRRTRYADSQTHAPSKAKRFENVRGCFGSKPGALKGLRVCIVDNLLNSGATLHEVAVAARRAGATQVYAAVVSRATPPGEDPKRSMGLESQLDLPNASASTPTTL